MEVSSEVQRGLWGGTGEEKCNFSGSKCSFVFYKHWVTAWWLISYINNYKRHVAESSPHSRHGTLNKENSTLPPWRKIYLATADKSETILLKHIQFFRETAHQNQKFLLSSLSQGNVFIYFSPTLYSFSIKKKKKRFPLFILFDSVYYLPRSISVKKSFVLILYLSLQSRKVNPVLQPHSRAHQVAHQMCLIGCVSQHH